MPKCIVCGSQTRVVLHRERLPVLQNVVYSTYAEAVNAPTGKLTLAECENCGFVFNIAFDRSLIQYAEHYDNDVPSPTFVRYYQSLAANLVDWLSLKQSVVYEIGCGKGTFLEALLRAEPSICAIGVDPSCQPRKIVNLELRRSAFDDQIRSDCKLVLLRHVLEHIEGPVDFMRAIRAAMPHGSLLYVEVPELTWIVAHGAWWDFCYEHCNYFTRDSLATALGAAGLRPLKQGLAFGNQYQWAICAPESFVAPRSSPTALGYEFDLRAPVGRWAIWGMATKGVVYSSIVPGALGGIDVNPKKQGKFAPQSGLQIHPPEWLRTVNLDTIVVMNPNYALEIRSQISGMGIDVELVVP